MIKIKHQRQRTLRSLASATLAAAVIACGPSLASESFEGKTIFFLVSSDAGGGYDVYTRLLARHLDKHITGKPTTVVQNMPGGGGLRVAQFIYAVAEKDGTKIGNLRASNMLDSVLGIRGADIDPRKFAWIGNMASDTDVCSFWRTSGVKTFDDLRKKEVLVGASGKGAQNYMFASAINHVLGTKMKLVLGYKGMGDRIIATERGELQGNCGMNASSLTSLQSDRLASGELIAVAQSGMRPYPTFKDVPLTRTFATTDKQREILDAIFSQMEFARTFALPPGTPPGIVEQMRTAFDATMKSPELLADATKQRLEISPSSGAEVEAEMKKMSSMNEEFKKEVREAIGD